MRLLLSRVKEAPLSGNRAATALGFVSRDFRLCFRAVTPMNQPIISQAFFKDVPVSTGLTSDEARRRLEKFGPNAVADAALHPLRRALTKFWAPVPWMLEAAIVLEVVLGKYVEAAIIAGLLAFNAALGYFQEGRAQATLAA
jgi:magnesium-transporting ATPase (P-type)